MSKKSHGLSTKAIHVGNDPEVTTGAVIPPIFQTTTYRQAAPNEHAGFEYTRCQNPTRNRLESCLASLENAQHCVSTASGLSALALILQTLPQGSRILCGDDVYGGTYRMFTTVYHERHEFRFEDTSQTGAITETIKQWHPHFIWLESPTNPLLKISDIGQICDAASKVGARVGVDNTFASPFFQKPLALGADLVLHSLTKYINGHSDVVGGAIMTNEQEWHELIWHAQANIGPSASPFDSWLVLRGVKTLGLRMERHELNAQHLAEWLEGHSGVEKVTYPGLASHPQHAIAKEQMSGFSGMLTFRVKGGLPGAKSFLQGLEVFTLAESLGGVESLIEHPASMTHASVPKEVREKIGITDGLVRLSVGIEDLSDLKDDLGQALERA